MTNHVFGVQKTNEDRIILRTFSLFTKARGNSDFPRHRSNGSGFTVWSSMLIIYNWAMYASARCVEILTYNV